LNERLRRLKPDPVRKARFREAAREIVAKDRHDRRYGLAIDTAGAIARALERAYRQGFTDAQSEPPTPNEPVNQTDGAIEWALIPPRPRNAFWSICLFICGRGDLPGSGGYLIPSMTNRGTPGWRLLQRQADHRNRYEEELGERTIVPLVRLGLLELAPDEPRRLIVSEAGKATWSQFLTRGGRYPEDLTNI
jgi:hypothetical protein